MDAEQRREAIRRMVEDDPTLGQREIAKRLGVSQKTISRDMIRMGLTQAAPAKPVSQAIPPQVSAPTQPPVSVVAGRGAELVTRIRQEMGEQGLIPTSIEEELLALAHGLAERIAVLQAVIAVDGERVIVKGRPMMHPALAEVRQCESTLGRILGGITTMDTEPIREPAKQRAAHSRWRRSQMAALPAGLDG